MPVKFSLVVPTYEEKNNLIGLYSKLNRVLSFFPFDSEVIIVDDNSPDLTWRIAEDLAKQDKRVKVIRRMSQRGLATAVLSGWAVAEGEILGVIDADLQHPPEILIEMLNNIINNHEIDIVVASRYVTGGKALNRNFLQILRLPLANFLGRIFIPKIFKSVKDPLSGYFILRRKVIESTKLTPIGYKILLEVLVRCQYRKILEIPFIFDSRKKGKSKAGWMQHFLFLFHLAKLR